MNKSPDIKKIKKVVVITLIQSFSLVYILTINNLHPDIVPYKNIVLDIIIFFNVIASLYNLSFLKDFDQLVNRFLSHQIIKAKAKQQEEFIAELRSQRHDFGNQLQTIGALAQMDKTDKIISYVREVGQDLIQLDADKYNSSTLELILEQKKKKAEKHNIDLDYQIESGLNNENLSLNDLFRLFYNLIDNALEAAKSAENPEVVIKGFNQGNNYVVSVYNNGDFITEKLKKKIKNPGKSTKGNGRGYGVYIISSLIEKADGELEIKSSAKSGTEFICYI